MPTEGGLSEEDAGIPGRRGGPWEGETHLRQPPGPERHRGSVQKYGKFFRKMEIRIWTAETRKDLSKIGISGNFLGWNPLGFLNCENHKFSRKKTARRTFKSACITCADLYEQVYEI